MVSPLAIITTNIIHAKTEKIVESIARNLDNAILECRLQVDSGKQSSEKRMITLIAFAVAVIVLAVANSVLSPRMP